MNKTKAYRTLKHQRRVERHAQKRRPVAKAQVQKRHSTPRSQRESTPMLTMPSLRALTSTPLKALLGSLTNAKVKFEAARFRHARQNEVSS